MRTIRDLADTLGLVGGRRRGHRATGAAGVRCCRWATRRPGLPPGGADAGRRGARLPVRARAAGRRCAGSGRSRRRRTRRPVSGAGRGVSAASAPAGPGLCARWPGRHVAVVRSGGRRLVVGPSSGRSIRRICRVIDRISSQVATPSRATTTKPSTRADVAVVDGPDASAKPTGHDRRSGSSRGPDGLRGCPRTGRPRAVACRTSEPARSSKSSVGQTSRCSSSGQREPEPVRVDLGGVREQRPVADLEVVARTAPGW